MDLITMILARNQSGGASSNGTQEPTLKTISSTVIPETELEIFNEDGAYCSILSEYIPCTDCTIYWNGEPFKCTPKDGADLDSDHVFGNLLVFGGEDTGEPFLIVIRKSEDETSCYIITTEPPADTTKIKVTIDYTFNNVIGEVNPSVLFATDGSSCTFSKVDSALMDNIVEREQSSFMLVIKTTGRANNDGFMLINTIHTVLMCKVEDIIYGTYFVGTVWKGTESSFVRLWRDTETGDWELYVQN